MRHGVVWNIYFLGGYKYSCVLAAKLFTLISLIMKRLSLTFAFFLAFLIFQSSTFAQTGIKGTATDPDGFGVISAAVVLKKDSLLIMTVTTDFDGNYIFSKLIAGTYELHFLSVEFQNIVIPNVIVQQDSMTRLDEYLLVPC